MERAIVDFGMVRPGDRIAVCVSGGPDSLSLLNLFADGFGYATSDFSLVAVHIDLGFPQPAPGNAELLESHFQRLHVEYRVAKTDIAGQVFSPLAKKNPCFLCSLHRRKRIYEIAEETHCNKIAYGHHQDDIIETLMINILYGRKIGTMYPIQDIFQGRMALIRPFLYARESLIKRFAQEAGLPNLPRLCPADGHTRRQRVKEAIARLQHGEHFADLRVNIFKSLYHLELREFSELRTRSTRS
jgi:tRNA 2-thiocytidine biosynthesis protein TtcA